MSRRRGLPPPHRATTVELRALFPFVVPDDLGINGCYIGREAAGGLFCFDPWECYAKGKLTSPNMVVFGQIGRGKSAFVKSFIWRQICFGRQCWVLDPKGEYDALALGMWGLAPPARARARAAAQPPRRWPHLGRRRRPGSLSPVVCGGGAGASTPVAGTPSGRDPSGRDLSGRDLSGRGRHPAVWPPLTSAGPSCSGPCSPVLLAGPSSPRNGPRPMWPWPRSKAAPRCRPCRWSPRRC